MKRPVGHRLEGQWGDRHILLSSGSWGVVQSVQIYIILLQRTINISYHNYFWIIVEQVLKLSRQCWRSVRNERTIRRHCLQYVVKRVERSSEM